MKLTLSFLFSLIVGLAFAFPQDPNFERSPTTPITPLPTTQIPQQPITPQPTTGELPITPPPTTREPTAQSTGKCCNSNIGYASGQNRNRGCTGNTILGGAIKGMTGLASWFAHEINILLGSEHLCPPKPCNNTCDQIPPIVNTTELAHELICESENPNKSEAQR